MFPVSYEMTLGRMGGLGVGLRLSRRWGFFGPDMKQTRIIIDHGDTVVSIPKRKDLT